MDPEFLKAYQDLQQAVALFQKGLIADAEKAFSRIVKRHPQYFDAVHFYGIFKLQQGDLNQALQLLSRACKIHAGSAAAFNNLGIVLGRLSRHAEALAAFDSAVGIDAGYVPALSNRANSLNELGRFREALDSCDRAIAIAPTHVEAFIPRGAALLELERFSDALASYQRATALMPNLLVAWTGYGNAAAKLKAYDQALAAYGRTLSLNPNDPDAWLGRGNVFYELERPDEALAAYDKALSLNPNLDNAWLGRGNALYDLNRHDEALTAYDKALSLKPGLENAWVGRGSVLTKLKRYDEALAAYDKALSLKPDFAEAWDGRGFVFGELKRYDEAFAAYDKSIAIKPDFVSAFCNKGLLKLRLGDFSEGWDLYEWRSRAKDHLRSHPHLNSLKHLVVRPDRNALSGKSVLVLAEQGVGDEIMFASALPDLIQDAKSVAYQIDDRLVALLKHSFPDVDVLSRKAPLDPDRFDAVIQAGSLGYAYRRDRAAFPGSAYLKPEPDRVSRWTERLTSAAGGAKKIGLSWRGGTDRSRRSDRSIALENLAPLLRRDGCHFVSLQYGNVQDEVSRFNAANPNNPLHCPLNDFNDFDEFAALISALDLVVSVQTAAVHMCGSLGQTCWGMIPWTPEWRYGADGDELVWYRSVKLYRQNSPGGWDQVLSSIANDLTRFCEGGN